MLQAEIDKYRGEDIQQETQRRKNLQVRRGALRALKSVCDAGDPVSTQAATYVLGWGRAAGGPKQASITITASSWDLHGVCQMPALKVAACACRLDEMGGWTPLKHQKLW